MDVSKRERKVDLEKMSEEDLKNIEKELSKKIFQITDEAADKANQVLKIYGLKAKMLLQVTPITEEKTRKKKKKE